MTDRCAFHYAPDGYSTAGPRLLREHGCKGRVEWIAQDRPQDLERYGTLYHPTPAIERLAWRRHGIGARRYSLCGITHTTASRAVMTSLANLLVAPVRSWDAVIRTSRAVRDSVRRRLGIEPGDVVFLFFGRLSFHAKAHPQQMFAALGKAAQEGGRIHLVLCGWFANEAIDKAFHEAAAQLCPTVALSVLDGRVTANQLDAWAAADVFISLADNVQETFGLTPLEAMAAGLPCIVSDWNGYRIPTVMSDAGAGLDLAQRYDDGADSYDAYCGHTSQACARLAGNAGLRRELGENGRQRVRAEFGWAVVFERYRALWRELGERRRADAQLGPALPAAVPDRLDPFELFASYPSMRITPTAMVELAPDASLALLRQYRELAINRFAHASLPTLEEFGQIFGAIGSRPMQVDELLDALGPCDRPTLLRGLAWLCKMDLLRIGAAEE
jgi:glycosyltransferase involved in cell wall biosynthesis